VTPIRVLLIPLALACAAISMPATADSLLVQRVERAKASSLPRAGASMVDVEAQYGAPTEKRDAVGQPPIARWIYPAFTVYFEYDKVVNAVVNKSIPEEVGPKPVPARQPKG
jgi:hypothetical protein